MPDHVLISIVSPVYKAESIIETLVYEIKENLVDISEEYEIILVEDGSSDKSWETVLNECQKDNRIKGIKLSRNFGQHYAITAGLSSARGEFVIVMDCDLQDNPQEFKNLYREIKKGYDLVLARRVSRQDSFLKKLTSKCFYSIFGYLTDTKQDASVANYGIYRKKVIDAILAMKDKVRYFPTMAQWVGFSTKFLDVKHHERVSGESSYNFRSLLNLAINNIIAFSTKPLLLTIKLGLIISILSFLLGGYYFILFIKGKIDEPGFPSLIISVWFIGGVIISILGMLGLYIGKMFNQTKDRPSYIIDKIVNL